jgi:predicted  nucleic acid-binding Zn-ribbon protein
MDIPKRTINNHYCTNCGRTTKHAAQGQAVVCALCGSTKVPVKKPGNKPMNFEDRIDNALGINEDSPKKPKLDGEKKKSTEGTHRPDKGAEYTQMKPDEKFKHKENYDTLKP